MRSACQLRVTAKFKFKLISTSCRCAFRSECRRASSPTLPRGPRTCPWTLTHPDLFSRMSVYRVHPRPWPVSRRPVSPFPGTRGPPVFLWVGLPTWPSGEESSYRCRRRGFDPWSGRSPGEGNGSPRQHCGLENPVDGGAWGAVFIVHGSQSQTRLSERAAPAVS